MTATDTGPGPTGFRVLLLGPFSVYRDGELLETATWQRTVLTLLKLLATAHAGRRLRDEVVDVLWPNAAPETGASNLRYVLSLLRRNLGGGSPPPVLSERGWLSLHPAYGWEIDLVRFELLIKDGNRAALEEAMRLYRGEPLEENRYDDWAMPVRDRITRAWCAAGLRLSDLAREEGDEAAAIAPLEQLLAMDPLDEEAMRRLLPLLRASGRRTEALRRYTQFEERLRRELNAAPSLEMVRTAEALREAPAPPTSVPSASYSPSGPALPPALPVGAYLGSLPSGALVGRQRLMRTILALVEAAHRGNGRLVLLAGEPGVGKTRLAQEVTQRLTDEGWAVVAGRCYEIEQSTPYYPFLDALGTLYAALPAPLQADAPARWPYLGRLLPDLIRTNLAEGAAQDEQQYLYRTVTSLLDVASRYTPVAVLLDDLHWSDAASLRLLLHLARHLRGSRVFLLGTYRDVEVGRHHPLEHALLDLSREDLVTRLDVRRLDREDTAALVATTLGTPTVPEAIADLIHYPTDGNPFFVQQIVRSMRDLGDLYEVNGSWERRESSQVGVPQSVRAVVGRRLSLLEETTQEILRDAGVLGQTFFFDDLMRVGQRDERVLEDALEEACEYGVIQGLGADEYGFDHALTRQTVVAELPARRLRRIHRAAAEAIASRVTRKGNEQRLAAEIAWHYLEADAQEEALHWSILAGDRAEAAFAHDEAEQHYRTALDIATELGDRQREAEALEKLGEVLITVARQADALPLEERAAELYLSLGDLVGEGRAVTRIAWAHAGLGKYADCLDRVQTTIARLERSGASRVLVDLYASVGFHLSMQGRLDEALANAAHLEQLARASNYRRYIAVARNMRGYTLWQMGRADEGLALIEGTLKELEAVGDLFGLGNSLESLAYWHLDRGELDRAGEYFRQALEVYVRRNDPTGIANALTNTAFQYFVEGAWDVALARAEEAVKLVEGRTDQPLTAFPMGFLGLLRVLRGDHRDITAYLEHCIAIAANSYGAGLVANMALAEYDLLQGRPLQARTRLETIVNVPYPDTYSILRIFPTLARACMETRDLAAAAAVVAGGMAGAERERNRIVAIELLTIRSELQMRSGQLPEAETTLAQALADARQIALPYHEAHLLVLKGTLYARRGEQVEARHALTDALEKFQRLGARPDVRRTQEMLTSVAH